MPAIIAGAVIYAILDEILDNPLENIFAQSSIWFGIGLNLVVRGYYAIKNMIDPGQTSIKYAAANKYALLFARFIVMYFLGTYFLKEGGTLSLYLFLICFTGFITYSELKPELIIALWNAKERGLDRPENNKEKP